MIKFILRHKLLLGINILFIIAISITEALQAILFQTVVDTVTGNLKYTISSLTIMSILFLLSVFFLETGSKVSAAALNKKVILDYKENMVKGFLTSSFKKKISNSEFISLINNDVKLIEENYIKSFICIAKDILLFVMSLFLLLRINIYLTIVIVLIGWLPIFIPLLLNKKNQRLKETYSKNLEIFLEKIREVSQGFEVIKSFNIEHKITNLIYADNTNLENAKFKSSSFEGMLGATSIVTGFTMFFINLLISGYFVLKGDITIGSMIAAVQLMNYIVNPLVSISQYTTRIKSVSKLIYKIEEKLLNKINTIDNHNLITEPINFEKSITIENLSYSYDNVRETLTNINLKIEKGKKYALVGESGCGKTTLLKILLNEINDYTGKVTIDNIDIQQIHPKILYDNITFIHQKIFMFKDTIKNNICLYNNFSDEQINLSIKQAGLSKTIQKHTNGYNTLIGEDGISLSGGEVQRVAIARSLIKNSQILLVDEATSALDNLTARAIENSLINLNQTVLSITHQLDKDILNKYDEIIVMKDGKIIEIGTFNDLVNRKGYFYYMYSM
ncbi:MAG: ABC transporter ATP-binding protein/permease [Clostridium sp.]|nr:ABC transporter ATP-binding protein/permease [Clostridium sp.]